MATYLEKRAEMDYTITEMKRETWEYENYPDGEKREMIELYQRKGLSERDASDLVNVLSRDTNNFIDTMMFEELGMLPPDPDQTPSKRTFLSLLGFLTCGFVPLAFHLFGLIWGENDNRMPSISCIASGLLVFMLGSLCARWTNKKWWHSGAVMLLNGGVAATISYFLGWWLNQA